MTAATESACPDAATLRVELSTERAPPGEKRDFGLDLGVRVIIETPGYTADQAIRVQ